MTERWFTEPRLDLGGKSTEAIVKQALDRLADIRMAKMPANDQAAAINGDAVDNARDALEQLMVDGAFCVVAKAAGLDPIGLLRDFEARRFDAIAADLEIIIAVGRTIKKRV